MSLDTRSLLGAGMLAGPLYLIVGYAQALTRAGFDFRRHPLSILSNGELGWIQVANFLVSGALVIAGAVGVRRALTGSRGGTWGPILFAGFGLGMIGAAFFKADPAPGFPPGTAEAVMTQTGMMHFVFGALAFYSLIAACFVFARRFSELGQKGWAFVSLVTGLVFFLTFGSLASGTTWPGVMLALYGVITGSFLWHSALHAKLRRES